MRPLNRSRPPSIARNLTVSLVATVLLVTGAVSAGYYFLLQNKERSNLETMADEHVQLIAESLALPMWFMHTDSIQSIARAYAANETVTGLVVMDAEGTGLFSYHEDDPHGFELRRSRSITYQGKNIGRVELFMTTRFLQENKRQLLVFGIVTIVFVSLALALFTGLFLRIFLKRPFDRLGRLVQAYGAGDLDVEMEDTPPREFRDLMETLQDMGRRLQDQMAALAATEDKYRSMFRNALEGMYQSSVDGKLLTANPAMAHMLGYESPEALLAACSNLAAAIYADPEDRDRYVAELKEKGRVRDFEAKFRKADGTLAWGRVQARLIRDESGNVMHIQGNSEDITSQVMTRQALQEAKEHAEAASRLKSDFLSMVSHDLRTPLTSILGFAKVILNRLEKTVFPNLPGDNGELEAARKQVADNLRIIVSEGKRLTAIINNVLDLSRLEAGRTRWDLGRADLNDLVLQCLEATDALFQEKGLAKRTKLAGNLPFVECDRDRIMQVLVNLVSNAVKFTDQGCVTCATIDGGDHVEVVVTDTGIGIPMESQDDIFDKFRQLGDTLTDKPDGTGLGLAICIQIVEQHDGRVWVESEPGKGSAFHFTVPLKARTAPDGKEA